VAEISDDVDALSAVMVALTVAFSVAQLPALSIPCGFAEELAIGLGLAGSG
jgi:Asp-tRNA(Asn)/Glu-tRNA(Gln) amidotransferase A subunit family amidase